MVSIALRSLLLGSLFAGALSPVLGQSPYPHSRVTLVTHSSAGGGSDVFLRELAKHLGPIMGTTFVVENVIGGSGARAMAHVAKAKPDGSVLYATTPTYIQTTLLSKPEVGYDALQPVAILFEDPEIVFTRADAPWKSLAEVIEHARRNPGKSRWGAANPASLERIALERMARKADVKVAVVPHEGGGDMMINVLNGTLDIGVGEMQELSSQVAAGKLRLLAVLSERRLAQHPNLPTAREQGVDLAVRKFRGLAGPRGIPDDIARHWDEAIKRVMEVPAYKESYTKNDLVPTVLPRREAIAFTNEFVGEIAQSMREFGLVK
jgi:tripartite-type tricarboxylate transporter receptor subunit TctC